MLGVLGCREGCWEGREGCWGCLGWERRHWRHQQLEVLMEGEGVLGMGIDSHAKG